MEHDEQFLRQALGNAGYEYRELLKEIRALAAVTDLPPKLRAEVDRFLGETDRTPEKGPR